MGIFSSKLNIARGTYNLNKVSENPIQKSDIINGSKNKEMMNALFNLFDVDGGVQDGVLSTYEQCRMADVFKSLDTDGDHKLSKQEFADGAVGTKLDGELLREFFMKALKSVKKNPKVSAQEAKEYGEQVRGVAPEKTEKTVVTNNAASSLAVAAKTEQQEPAAKVENTPVVNHEEVEESETPVVAQNTDEESTDVDTASNTSAIESQAKAQGLAEEDTISVNETEIQAPPAQKNEPVQKSKPELHNYTVQMNETFTNIIKKSLAAQGIANPTAEEIEAAKEEFRQNNPKAIKKTKNGYEYLLVGAQVKLSGNVENKNNSKAQIEAWAARYGTKKAEVAAPKEQKKTAEPANAPENQATNSVETEEIAPVNKREAETIKDKDGNITGAIKREYNKDGKVVEEKKLDKNGVPVQKTQNTYSKSGLLVSKTITDGLDNVKQTIDYLYYEDGREAQRTYKDKDGNITNIIEVGYETTKNPDVVKSELIKDKDGNKQGGVVQYKDGAMDYYYYNKDSNPVQMYSNDKDGKGTKSANFEYYESGLPKRSTYVTKDGTEIYKYNEDGSYEYTVLDKDNKPLEVKYADIDDNSINKEEYNKRKTAK